MNAPAILRRILSRLQPQSGMPRDSFLAWSRANEAPLLDAVSALERRKRPSPRRPSRRPEPTEGHVDVGEVILGARKMTWAPGTRVTSANLAAAEMTERPHKLVIKANVLPPLDIDAERENGASPGAAWLKRKVFEAVAPGPGVTGAGYRKFYVAGAEWLVTSLAPLLTVAAVMDFVEDWALALRGALVQPEVYTGAELRAMFPPGAGEGRVFIVDYSPDQRAALDELKTLRRAAVAAEAYEEANVQRAAMYKIEEAGRVGLPTAAMRAKGYTGDVKRRDDGRYQLYRASPNNPVGLQSIALGGVDGEGEAAITKSSVKRSRLLSLLFNKTASFWKNDRPFARDIEARGDWSPLAPKITGASESRTSGRWTRAATEQRRSGPPTGAPLHITGEQLRDAFAFRGIQYGNWVEQGSRGQYLTLAYDAFSDLADLLGQGNAFITHNGVLALAFGARGTGREGASFDPGLRVVNLTHTRGDGSFAHEWGHFLDHELLADPTAHKLLPGGKVVSSTASAIALPVKFRGRLAETGSGSPLHPALHPEVTRAVSELMQALHVPSVRRTAELTTQGEDFTADIKRQFAALKAIRETLDYNEYVQRHNAIVGLQRARTPSPNRTTFSADVEMLGPYMWTPTEMFARAFESWAEDKLESLGRENTYLVYGTRELYDIRRIVGGVVVDGLEPYPHGTERADITAAVERLVQSIARHGLPKAP